MYSTGKNIKGVSLEDRISLLLAGIFLATLPLDRFYSQLALGGLIIHTLIHFQKEKLRRFPLTVILLLTSVFLLNIVGMIWSADKSDAIKDMQRQLAIIIF